ncbi:MAG: alpha/beta fold hydrolase [Bacteroidota bacterium]
MPIVSSTYSPPFYLKNGHLATILPSSFRKVEGVQYERERIDTPDGDFLDIDWSKNNNSDQLVIVSHGLEGSSLRPYVQGVVKYFNEQGWSALAWNCRSCSGEINRVPRFYHHGATEDLAQVVDHATNKQNYRSIVLVGFSMGGSMTLKYLGERDVDPLIKSGVAFSVPVDLQSGVDELAKKNKSFYRKRFLKKLAVKIKAKAEKFPELVDATGVDEIEHFPTFDNRYTAPLHGFKNAEDFYDKASSKHYLSTIKVPTLLVNAFNDPFLADECYPEELCRSSSSLYLEMPKFGGHVGFSLSGKKYSYMEQRAFEFIKQYI